MKTFTKLLNSYVFAALMILAAGNVAFAQEEEEDSKPELSISGSIDAYFRANLNATNEPLPDGSLIAPGSSFANLPGFSLGMANIVVGMDGEKTGFVADLVFGPRGNDAVFGSIIGSTPIVNQLYAYWNVSESTTLTIGNFNTFLGYEVISPTANFNYSTSYMFSYGPFSHSGLKADFTLSETTSLMLAVMNPTDATDFNPTGDYVLGAQLGVSGQYFNFIYDGANDFTQFDFTGGFDLSDNTYLGINATTASDNFLGAALYLQNSFSDDFSLGFRGEYFQDKGLGLVALDDTIIDLTLSANYSVGNMTIIPEIRIDMFDTDIVTDASGITANGDFTGLETSKSLSSFVLAAVYSF